MRLNWQSALGIVLSAGLLVWTLRNESASEIWSVLSQSNLPLLVLGALVATSIFPLRAIRWRIILDPMAANLPIGALWRSIAVGMMVNNIYPARLGEVARAYALTRETKRVSLTGAVASLAVDRVFDAIVLMLLLVSAMLAPDFPKDMVVGGQPVQRGAFVFGLGAVGLLVLLYVIVAIPERLVAFYAAVVGRVAPRLVKRGSEIRDYIVVTEKLESRVGEEWAFDKPVVLLRSGERIAVKMPTADIEVATRYGLLKLAPQTISALALQNEENGVHEIYLTDGSKFAGLVTAGSFEMKLAALMFGIDEDIGAEIQDLSDMLAGRPKETRRDLLQAMELMLRAGGGPK